MNVEGNHPLAEILAKRLFGISRVPLKEAELMIRRTCTSAIKWHEENSYKNKAEQLRQLIKDYEDKEIVKAELFEKAEEIMSDDVPDYYCRGCQMPPHQCLCSHDS